jgi:hypothetical protein
LRLKASASVAAFAYVKSGDFILVPGSQVAQE